ncbi:hypothetical protein ACEPAI_9586 [Sanghuangporus weigelae]
MFFKLSVSFIAFAAIAGAANIKSVRCPDGNFASDEACCPFFSLRDDLQSNLFDNECGMDAQDSVRLAFHDAIGFSRSGKFKGTGADGSMVIFRDIETKYAANAGIDEFVEELAPFLTRHNVTGGDLIQFASAVGFSNCPGATRLQFLAGRPNATFPAEDGTVPLPQNDASTILERMADGGGFSPAEVVHLLASHSIADSDTLVPGHSPPFDSTQFTFDTQFFLEVMLKGVGLPFGVNSSTPGAEVDSPLPEAGEMRLQSDFVLSRDKRTACEWQSLIDNQDKMVVKFKTAMAKLAAIGHNPSTLVDCSDVVPEANVPLKKKHATLPAGKNYADIEQACTSPFPRVGADSGRPTKIPLCPEGSDDDDCES